MNIDLKVIGYFKRKETSQDIDAALKRISNLNFSVHMQGDDWDLTSVGQAELPDVIICELNGERAHDIDELEKILKEYKDQVVVYVTYQQGDMDTMRKLMRAGVRDAFPQPVQAEELVENVINVLSEKRHRMQKKGRGHISAFISSKGGTGSTTVAVNVAHFLAKTYAAKVALIDLDIQFGDTALFLDLHPRNNVLEALLQPDRIDPIFLRALMTKFDDNLDVLASPGDVSPLGGITADAVLNLLNAASDAYDHIIVDVPHVLTSWSLASLRFSDPVFLVAQNNIATIRGAKILLDRLVHEGMSFDRLEVINNRAMSKDSSVPIEKLKETLGKKLVHKVRNDYHTAVHAQDQGRTLEEVSKRSGFTKDIQHLAEYIFNMQNGLPRHQGLFSKLFSNSG